LEPAGLDYIEIYTDGACKGNPGHAALGVVMRYGSYHREIRQFLGTTTNNVAELMAIKVGLEQVKDPAKLPVRVFSDSRYAINVLTGANKARRNGQLIREIQAVMATFPDLGFHWVEGHAGNPLNERVDELANLAIKEERERRR
jgi:ribonuclease HI